MFHKGYAYSLTSCVDFLVATVASDKNLNPLIILIYKTMFASVISAPINPFLDF